MPGIEWKLTRAEVPDVGRRVEWVVEPAVYADGYRTDEGWVYADRQPVDYVPEKWRYVDEPPTLD